MCLSPVSHVIFRRYIKTGKDSVTNRPGTYFAVYKYLRERHVALRIPDTDVAHIRSILIGNRRPHGMSDLVVEKFCYLTSNLPVVIECMLKIEIKAVIIDFSPGCSC